MVRYAIFVLMLCGAALSHATEVRVSVEPPAPVANESFRVIFSADGPVDSEPDFSELDGVFEIIGRNRQTSIEWINGRNSSTTTWALDVIARKPGSLSIPAVAFGKDRSRATVIDIAAAAGGGAAPSDSGLMLETEVDKPNPYVQEQVILTVRLLRRVELNDANLTEPSSSADAIIKRMGKDSTYQTMRDQKRYEVFERRFAIFPQTSGPMTIEPMVLTAQIVQSSRSVFDPFRQSVKTKRVESNAIDLDVKPVPPQYTGTTWLPAKRLRLRDDWTPDAGEIQAGEPLTRTVILWADGLNSGQLPDIPLALPDGLKSYPDQPQASELDTEAGFTATRQQKFAIIPNAATTIDFPEISVTWWNTETDSMEVARLPARHFDVVGAPPAPAAAGPAPAAAPIDVPEIATTEPVPTDSPAPQVAVSDDYRLLAIVGLLGWLLTALAWWIRHRRGRRIQAAAGPVAETESLSRVRRDVRGACKAGDAQGVKRALINWGRIAFTRPQLLSLGELADLAGEPLETEIRRLDKSIYGREAEPWNRDALLEAFEAHTQAPDRERNLQTSVKPLPDLYRLTG